MWAPAQQHCSSDDFVVFCPSHPDIMLSRQRRRSLFGRNRVEVVHKECPRCQEEWPDLFLGAGDESQEPFRSSVDGASSHFHSYDQTTRTSNVRPSAPYMDEVHENGNSSSPLHNTTETTRQSRSEIPNQQELAENITKMVHSLLDRDDPNHGPDFAVEQLEMLCAWTLGEFSVRKLITDVGGIYIVINILQSCQERYGPRRRSGRERETRGPLGGTPSSQTTDQQPFSISTGVHPYHGHEDAHGSTTLATQTMADDASTIVTNDADIDDAIAQFASMEQDNDILTPLGSQLHAGPKPAPIDDSSSRAFSSARTWTTTDGDASDSRPLSHSMLSYPGCYYFPPTANHRNTAASTSSARASAAHASAVGPLNPFSSPPPPTMDDIDKAFGHFLIPESSANDAAFGGNASTAGASQAQWTKSVTATEYDDMSEATTYARSTAYNGVVRRAPSVAGSSVSAYISARAPREANSATPNLDTTGTDPVILEARWGIATLANLSQDPIAVDIIRSAGGVPTLLSTMWLLENDEMIQDCGCECLSHLVSVGSNQSHIKAVVISYGAIATVLRAMTLFPATPTLQHKCCLFIGQMVIGDPVVLQSIMTLRGIELITLAMRLHRLDEKLQEAACVALENIMAEGGRVYAEVVSCRGIEAILTAMWQYEENSFIQEHGCFGLGYICASDDGNKPALTDAGAVETILLAMRKHEHNAHIQRAGCHALCNLTERYGPAAQRALDENAMEVIRKVAVQDQNIAKELRTRLYKYRSTTFKQV
ncbi:hypothetical protein ACA910_014244 [Epithemia clementina (nom. ined.)]